MQDIWRQSAALEAAFRQWELRYQRLNNEAADADSDSREQLLVVEGLKLRQQHVLEEVQASIAKGDISIASGAQQEHQELEAEIAAAESVLADLKAAAQQLHSDTKAAEGETERLRHRVFLCTCVVQFVRQSSHWERQWQAWHQCAEQSHCRASQQHRAHIEHASNEVYAICLQETGAADHALPEYADTPGESPARGHLQLEQEALHAENEASAALHEMRKSLNVADLLHSCMLSLSNSDEFVERVTDAEQALNAALMNEQNCKETVKQLRSTFEAEFERVCARLATAGTSGLLPLVACFEELAEECSEARGLLYAASHRVREHRAKLQKLQIQQHACLHMEHLVRVAHEHDRASQTSPHADPALQHDSTKAAQPQLQCIDECCGVPDSRESTLTVAEGIPRLSPNPSRHTSSSSQSSEAFSGSHQPETRSSIRRSAIKSKDSGKVWFIARQLHSTAVVF